MWWQPSKRPHLKLSKRLGVVQSARGATPPPSKPDTDRRLPRAGSWRSFKTSRPTSTTPRLQVHRRRAKAPSPSGARARALLVLGVALRCEGGPGRARGGALLAPGVASPCLAFFWSGGFKRAHSGPRHRALLHQVRRRHELLAPCSQKEKRRGQARPRPEPVLLEQRRRLVLSPLERPRPRPALSCTSTHRY